MKNCWRGNGRSQQTFYRVIETMKCDYRRQLLRQLLRNLLVEGEDEVCSNYKKLNLKYYAYMVTKAWNLINVITLRRA